VTDDSRVIVSSAQVLPPLPESGRLVSFVEA
jgi:hypothetical protein